MPHTLHSNRDASFTSLIFQLQTEHQRRLRFYQRAWNFYRGIHWGQSRPEDEAYVTLNYCRKFVDKHTNFLFGRGIKIGIPDDAATPENETLEKEFIRVALEEVWARSSEDSFLLELGQMGSVTGDAFVKIAWESEDPFTPPRVRLDMLPSGYVFPYFGGPRGVDRKKVNSILVIYPRYKDPYASAIQNASGIFSANVQLYAEHWYPTHVDIFFNMRGGVKQQPDARFLNPIGRIPIVHIANYPMAAQYFGVSDLVDIIPLQVELNEKATDMSDVINYHASPVTVITGASVSSLERGANKMWGMPDGSKVKNLEMTGDMAASMNYFRAIKTAFHEIGSVPEGVLGTVQENVEESAAARALQYMPLTEVRRAKIKTYGQGIREINEISIRMLDLFDNEFHAQFVLLPKTFSRFKTTVGFADPLPRDESIQLSNDEKRLTLGLDTRKKILEREGKSRAEIDEILADADAERDRDAKREFNIGQQFSSEFDDAEPSGNPNPTRPNPDLQSERRSIAAQQSATNALPRK